jgi:Fe-S cluster biogenesis protein NfuA
LTATLQLRKQTRERANEAMRLRFKEIVLDLIDKDDSKVLILPGRYLVGKEGKADATQREVVLDAFLIDRHLTTNQEFEEFAAKTGFGGSDHPFRKYSNAERMQHPVVCVSQLDAKKYSHWKGNTLPTESMWEVAMRGGLIGKIYPFGDELPSEVVSGMPFDPKTNLMPPTSPVNSGPSNSFGIVHPVGNVWQLCSDFYSPKYYESDEKVNPKGPQKGEYAVRRGGAYNVAEDFRLEVANRGTIRPEQREPNTGFRGASVIPFSARALAAVEAAALPMIADGGGIEIIDITDSKQSIELKMRGTCEYCPNISQSAESLIDRIGSMLFDALEIIVKDKNVNILARKEK